MLDQGRKRDLLKVAIEIVSKYAGSRILMSILKTLRLH